MFALFGEVKMEIQRRQFFTGLAAILFVGQVPIKSDTVRFIPKIEFTGLNLDGSFTYSFFKQICDELVDKISALGPLDEIEQEYVAACIR